MRPGRPADEAFGVRGVRRVQHARPLPEHERGAPGVDDFRCEPGEAGVTVLGVVPGAEAPAERVGVVEAREGIGELGVAT